MNVSHDIYQRIKRHEHKTDKYSALYDGQRNAKVYGALARLNIEDKHFAREIYKRNADDYLYNFGHSFENEFIAVRHELVQDVRLDMGVFPRGVGASDEIHPKRRDNENLAVAQDVVVKYLARQYNRHQGYYDRHVRYEQYPPLYSK
jgi:hypothetical protein